MNSKMNYKLSIIIPVYNLEKYIDRCLNSIFVQENQNFEVIIINDGSTDTSSFIIENAIKDKNNYKLFNVPNSGVSAARNLGLRNASGEYVFFLDGDDWISENFEKKITELIDYSTDLIMFGFKVWKQDLISYKEILPSEKILLKNNFSLKEFYIKNEQLNFFSPWNKIYRKSLLLDNNIFFREGQKFGEDAILNMHVLRIASNVLVIPQALYNYRDDRDGSAHHTYSSQRLSDLIVLLNEINTLLEHWKIKEQIGKSEELKTIFHAYINFSNKKNYCYKEFKKDISQENILMILNDIKYRELRKKSHKVKLFLCKNPFMIYIILKTFENKKNKFY